MAKLRTINYGKMLYETNTAWFSVNASGEISILYKFLAALIQPLQPAFNGYDSFRKTQSIIASCMWQMGQLKNVLNYLYDNVENRIFITQSSFTIASAVEFEYPAIMQASEFDDAALTQLKEFDDAGEKTLLTFHVPGSVDTNAITATIEQIKLDGIPYQIVTI